MSCVQANCRCDELQSRPQAQLTSCVQCLVRFSASGVYSLRATGLPNTNPRTSSLAVSRYGQLEWSAVKPYVLSDATVGDDASVLGHLWWRDEAASADAPYGHDYIRLLLLDPSGTELLDETIAYLSSNPHIEVYPDPPYVRGQLIDIHNRVAIVLLVEPAGRPQDFLFGKPWGKTVGRVYQLSTGRLLEMFKCPAVEILSSPLDVWRR